MHISKAWNELQMQENIFNKNLKFLLRESSESSQDQYEIEIYKRSRISWWHIELRAIVESIIKMRDYMLPSVARYDLVLWKDADSGVTPQNLAQRKSGWERERSAPRHLGWGRI